jgi:hypothetical protein
MMIAEMPKGGRRPGAGRPKKKAAERLSDSILLRATSAQLTAWHRAAVAKRKPLAVWAREVLDLAAAGK